MAQTLRRFGGRQPLCGIGVTSLIDFTCSPAAASAWIADSRPEPGPLHADVHPAHAERHRLARALFGGDRRRERRGLLRTLEPGLARRAPRHRVPVRIGDRDGRVVERRADVGDAFGLDHALGLLSGSHYLVTFFLPAIARRGPFLVRALVCVRWPRTGKAAAMANAAIRSDVHQALDVHRDFGAQGAFDAIRLLDLLAEPVDVGVGEVLDALVGADAGRGEDAARGHAADAVDVGQADLDASSRAADRRRKCVPSISPAAACAWGCACR